MSHIHVLLTQLLPCMILYADLTITTEKLMEIFATLDPETVDKLGGEDHLGPP